MNTNNRGKAIKRDKHVAGIGVNDTASPIQVTEYVDGIKTVHQCPYYKKWSLMLERCYKRDYGSFVCTEWLLFSNFKSWCISQEKEVGDISLLQLDKDLFSFSDIKIYSPDTCCFLPKTVNSFITSKKRSGSLPLGVYVNKKGYSTSYSNPLTGKRCHIGTYNTPYQAHEEWLSHKRDICSQIIDAGLVSQLHVKQALLNYY